MENSKDISGISRRALFEGALSLGAMASLALMPGVVSANVGVGSSTMKARSKSLAMGIEKAINRALDRTTAKYPLGQASAVMHVLQNMQLGLAMNYVNSDPARPTLFNYMNSHVKQGGDNTDAFYSGFAVDARNTYRLHGNLGTAKYVSITTVEKSDSSPWGGGMGAALYGHQMEVAKDGSFELIISAKPHKGNWLKITERDFRVTIRQFFADWEAENPMQAAVELVGVSNFPAIELSADHIMSSLDRTVDWLSLTVDFWQDIMDLYRKYPNQFKSWRELTGDGVNATPGGDPECCFWTIPKGKALIMRVTPPECLYWNVEFNNPWWETMDYRHHLAGTNSHHAVLEENGEVIIVAAHQDPGLPNWLDTCGHTEGMMGRRWMFAKENPRYQTTLVDHEKLFEYLPRHIKRITPGERAEQIEARRRGLYKRFVTL